MSSLPLSMTRLLWRSTDYLRCDEATKDTFVGMPGAEDANLMPTTFKTRAPRYAVRTFPTDNYAMACFACLSPLQKQPINVSANKSL
mmetsp:Transcript_519/g.672  ORF Transcript_519/g.672 Transcript_519/m.672 type:complete len:87 (-) Transcript_519:14-274(-)